MEDIRAYLSVIQRWWWVIVGLCAATIGSMLVIAFLTETMYQATVTIQVSAPPPQEAPLYSEFGRQALYEEIQQNRTSFNEFLLEGGLIPQVLDMLPDVPLNTAELQENVTIDLPDNSQLMRIQVRTGDPKTAALLANTLVELGLQQYGKLRAQSTASALEFIKRQLEEARTELHTAETDLSQFQIANKIGALDSAINGQYDALRNLGIQRDLASSEGNPAKAQALDDIILDREADLQTMIALSAEYDELRDRVERTRATVNFLLDKEVEAQIKENQILDVGFIQIITPAQPPRRPIASINSSLIGLGALGSILAGILLAFLLEYLKLSSTSQSSQKRTERPEVVALPDRAAN